MPGKRKKKKFSAAKHVKALSRAVIGKVPVARAVPTKKERVARKDTKHKSTLGEMLDQE
jgi:hypothetical protein